MTTLNGIPVVDLQRAVGVAACVGECVHCGTVSQVVSRETRRAILENGVHVYEWLIEGVREKDFVAACPRDGVALTHTVLLARASGLEEKGLFE